VTETRAAASEDDEAAEVAPAPEASAE
jgi:hypothetical protein